MDVNFGALASHACAGSLSNVLIHVGPNVHQCNQVLSGTYAWVGKAMELVEDLSAELRGYIYRAWGTLW